MYLLRMQLRGTGSLQVRIILKNGASPDKCLTAVGAKTIDSKLYENWIII